MQCYITGEMYVFGKSFKGTDELEKAANEPREALKQIEKERVRNQIKDDLNELRKIGQILSGRNVIDSKGTRYILLQIQR